MTQEFSALPQEILPQPALAPNEIVPMLIGSTVGEIERELVLQTLARCDGNRTRAARVLGLDVSENMLARARAFAEPLLVQDTHFVESLRTGRPPATPGERGLDVVRVLASTDEVASPGTAQRVTSMGTAS